ncbi:MAG: hypothetical protein IPI11_14760 [Haliscomenobacter sp.]|nr:hypothetical protein [Haliscomenobacter sp.]
MNHWSNRNALRQGGQYLEILNTRREVRTLGLAARAGALFFSARNRRLIVEPYIGLGWAVHRVRFSPPRCRIARKKPPAFSSNTWKASPLSLTWLFGIHLGIGLDVRGLTLEINNPMWELFLKNTYSIYPSQ